MSTLHHLQLPIDEAAVKALRVGDQVMLSGDITMTIGMPTHQRMLDLHAAGQALPVNLAGSGFFHLSAHNREFTPGNAAGGYEALYMNPSTSTRYNPFMPGIIRAFGLRLVGGKGGLDAACVEAMREAGCAYLSFLGGGCTLLSQAIRSVTAINWPEFIPQFRLVTLRVENLGPNTVAIDAHGNSIYQTLADEARQRLPDILRELEQERSQSVS